MFFTYNNSLFLKSRSFMAALVLLGLGMFPLGAPGQAKKPVPEEKVSPVCKAEDFRSMAYSINDVQAREKRALEWLSRYGKDCSYNEIEAIRSNVAVWLGTADTDKVHQTVKELHLNKKPPPSTLEVSKSTTTAPVIAPSGSIDTMATKKVKRLPNKVDEKTAASKEYSLRDSEIAQCLPNEIANWNDGAKDTKMLSPSMVYVYEHQGAPAGVSEDAVFSVLQQAASAWDQCGGQNTVMLKRDLFDTKGIFKIAVQWNDDDKLGTIGLANITKKTLTLSPEAFANLKKANASRNLMETLQMVVSHEVGHFQGMTSHSRRCVDVLSYYSNDAGEKCFIRDNGVMPKNFEYRSLLPTACDIQRCRMANTN